MIFITLISLLLGSAVFAMDCDDPQRGGEEGYLKPVSGSESGLLTFQEFFKNEHSRLKHIAKRERVEDKWSFKGDEEIKESTLTYSSFVEQYVDRGASAALASSPDHVMLLNSDAQKGFFQQFLTSEREEQMEVVDCAITRITKRYAAVGQLLKWTGSALKGLVGVLETVSSEQAMDTLEKIMNSVVKPAVLFVGQKYIRGEDWEAFMPTFLERLGDGLGHVNSVFAKIEKGIRSANGEGVVKRLASRAVVTAVRVVLKWVPDAYHTKVGRVLDSVRGAIGPQILEKIEGAFSSAFAKKYLHMPLDAFLQEVKSKGSKLETFFRKSNEWIGTLNTIPIQDIVESLHKGVVSLNGILPAFTNLEETWSAKFEKIGNRLTQYALFPEDFEDMVEGKFSAWKKDLQEVRQTLTEFFNIDSAVQRAGGRIESIVSGVEGFAGEVLETAGGVFNNVTQKADEVAQAVLSYTPLNEANPYMSGLSHSSAFPPTLPRRDDEITQELRADKPSTDEMNDGMNDDLWSHKSDSSLEDDAVYQSHLIRDGKIEEDNESQSITEKKDDDDEDEDEDQDGQRNSDTGNPSNETPPSNIWSAEALLLKKALSETSWWDVSQAQVSVFLKSIRK